jgi:hypothetical protein
VLPTGLVLDAPRGTCAKAPTNASLEIARYDGATVAPVIAGVLAASLSTGAALLADAGSFAALAIASATPGASAAGESRGGEGGDSGGCGAREGFSFLWGEPVLRLAAVVLTITVVFAVMDNVALVFFAKEPWRLARPGYGTLITVWTAGIVAGIVLVARRLGAQVLAPAVILADTSTGLAVLTAAAWPVFGFVVGLFVVGGAGNGMGNVARRSLIHLRTRMRRCSARGRSRRSLSEASSSRRWDREHASAGGCGYGR